MNEFPAQLEEATAFLSEHESWLAELCGNAAVEDARLDFGIERSQAWIQCLVLPPAFLGAACRAGVSVELSMYSPSQEV
jgi:hypothetical protein